MSAPNIGEKPGEPVEPPGGGTPPGGEPPPSEPAGEPGFDRGKLHPALREMSPEDITELFETMAGTLRTVQSRDTSGIPAHARPPEPPPQPKREPITKDKYRELLDPGSDTFNPEEAFRAFAEQNYGQLVGDINARSIRGLFGTFRTEFEDFKDYETDVTQALQGRDPTSLTEQDVLNTYLMAKGLRATLQQRSERAKKATTTVAPSPAIPPGTKKEVELTDLEVEIANKMFRRIKDPAQRVAEYKKFAARDEEGGMTVQVPTGGGKKE